MTSSDKGLDERVAHRTTARRSDAIARSSIGSVERVASRSALAETAGFTTKRVHASAAANSDDRDRRRHRSTIIVGIGRHAAAREVHQVALVGVPSNDRRRIRTPARAPHSSASSHATNSPRSKVVVPARPNDDGVERVPLARVGSDQTAGNGHECPHASSAGDEQLVVRREIGGAVVRGQRDAAVLHYWRQGTCGFGGFGTLESGRVRPRWQRRRRASNTICVRRA